MPHTDGNASVLLIEDDDDTRENLQLLLELKGFRVRAAANGREGLRVLDEGEATCLILLDWMMPIMNGREFLDSVRSHPRHSGIPVVVVTAHSGLDPAIPSRHLKKPVEMEDLVREVSAHCASAPVAGDRGSSAGAFGGDAPS